METKEVSIELLVSLKQIAKDKTGIMERRYFFANGAKCPRDQIRDAAGYGANSEGQLRRDLRDGRHSLSNQPKALIEPWTTLSARN